MTAGADSAPEECIMSAYEGGLERFFSLKQFLLALAIVLMVFLSLACYAALMKDRTMAMLETRLASYTVEVEKPEAPPAAPVPIPDKGESAKTQSPEADLPVEAKKTAVPVKSLPSAPLPGMTEASEYGELPVLSGEDSSPFDAYKKPAILNRDRPMLAVAVTDYGLSESLSEMALGALPAEVSLILNPYTAQADLWQKKAREDGHEIWLQLFTATRSFPFRDPGAKGLLAAAGLKYNQDRLYWTMGRTTGYAGIAAFTDSAMNAGAPVFRNLARDIFKRGLGYLEINPGRDSFLMPLALDAKAPHAQAAFTLDASGAESPDTPNIEKHIRDHGGALVIVRATPGNIKFLRTWLERMRNSGINIVPASALAEIGRGE